MGSHTIPLQSFKDWKSETRSKPQDGTSDSNRILDISVAHSVNPIANHAIFMRKHTNKQGIVGLSNAHARLLTPLNLPFADWTASEKQPILAGKMADLVANYQYKLEVIMQPKLFKFIGYRPPLNPLASKLRVGDMSCSPKSSGNTLNHAQTKTKSMNHLGNVALDGMHNEKRRSLHYVNNAVLPAISGRTTDTGKEASRRRSGTILGSNLDIAECHSKERVEISKKWRRSFAAMIFSARMIIISRTRLAEFEYGSNAKSLRVTAFTAIGQVEADPLLTHRVLPINLGRKLLCTICS